MMLLWCLSAFAVAAQSELLQEPYSRPAYSHTLTGILGDAAEESTCALVQRRTSRSGHSTSPTSLAPSIPAVLHQSWKDTSVPQHLSEYKSTWQIVHPGWMYKFFTDDDNAELWKESSKETFTFYESLSEPVMRADASRLLYMKHFGGVYADLDVEPCQNMDRLLRRWQLIFVRSPRVFVSNFFIASTAGHPFWDYALHQLSSKDERIAKARNDLKKDGKHFSEKKEIMWTAGPHFLDEALTSFLKGTSKEIKDKVKIYEFHEWQKDVGAHHWSNTWLCPKGDDDCDEATKFAAIPTDGKDMGVNASTACSEVSPDSLSALSGRNMTSNATGDLCFVHIGKTGGEAIIQGLRALQRKEKKIGYLVQLHGTNDLSGRRNDTKAGPVMGSRRELCAGTGAILLWLRDPVSRFVSLWKFFVDPRDRIQTIHANLYDGIFAFRRLVITHSLNRSALPHNEMSLMQLDLDVFLNDLFSRNASTQDTILRGLPHATQDLSWYFGGCDAYNMATMPISFVGATESMDQDWQRFVGNYDSKVQLHQSHATNQTGHHLSPSTVAALRKYYAKDYACIAKLVDANRVSAEYLANITSESNVYKY
eukprot:TRINITY_DN2688_c0_g1_i1.p1 TRINITY_DN2688_c0_g1~~TRINITY_DN2688_c0_g1_i1.p1  ORF type:complete len:637 (+),score=102.64 TRINITY_DN2688_c0_g1_i1:132-1913(+)